MLVQLWRLQANRSWACGVRGVQDAPWGSHEATASISSGFAHEPLQVILDSVSGLEKASRRTVSIVLARLWRLQGNMSWACGVRGVQDAPWGRRQP